MKRGILLVAFGAGNIQSASTLRLVQRCAEERFQIPVRWAFTSESMRERLAQARTKSDSVLKALRRMQYERYTQVAVQSLHLIPGLEYTAVLRDVQIAAREGNMAVCAGAPLLRSFADMETAAAALLRHLPAERSAADPVVCMAHGSRHDAEYLYEGLDQTVRGWDPAVRVACMKGSITLETLMPELKEAYPPGTLLWLLPLLSVVGKHTLQDMAGAGPQSWKQRLEEAGFICRADLRGLADGPDFVELWMRRLESALAELDGHSL